MNQGRKYNYLKTLEVGKCVRYNKYSFEDVMSKEFGEIEYNESEYLNLGADYTEPEKKCDFAGKAELDIINLKDSTQDEETDVEEETAEELLEKTEIEAKFIAKKYEN